MFVSLGACHQKLMLDADFFFLWHSVLVAETVQTYLKNMPLGKKLALQFNIVFGYPIMKLYKTKILIGSKQWYCYICSNFCFAKKIKNDSSEN